MTRMIPLIFSDDEQVNQIMTQPNANLKGLALCYGIKTGNQVKRNLLTHVLASHLDVNMELPPSLSPYLSKTFSNENVTGQWTLDTIPPSLRPSPLTPRPSSPPSVPAGHPPSSSPTSSVNHTSTPSPSTQFHTPATFTSPSNGTPLPLPTSSFISGTSNPINGTSNGPSPHSSTSSFTGGVSNPATGTSNGLANQATTSSPSAGSSNPFNTTTNSVIAGPQTPLSATEQALVQILDRQLKLWENWNATPVSNNSTGNSGPGTKDNDANFNKVMGGNLNVFKFKSYRNFPSLYVVNPEKEMTIRELFDNIVAGIKSVNYDISAHRWESFFLAQENHKFKHEWNPNETPMRHKDMVEDYVKRNNLAGRGDEAHAIHILLAYYDQCYHKDQNYNVTPQSICEKTDFHRLDNEPWVQWYRRLERLLDNTSYAKLPIQELIDIYEYKNVKGKKINDSKLRNELTGLIERYRVAIHFIFSSCGNLNGFMQKHMSHSKPMPANSTTHPGLHPAGASFISGEYLQHFFSYFMMHHNIEWDDKKLRDPYDWKVKA